MEYPSISKVFDLGDGMLVGVDQSNSNEDKTCLCMAKFKDGIMDIKEIKYIEKQEDIDKYINKNTAKIYEAFGVPVDVVESKENEEALKTFLKFNNIDNKEYPIKYTGEECPECGRLRVELWSNGNRICEKCNWNLEKKEYEPSDI